MESMSVQENTNNKAVIEGLCREIVRATLIISTPGFTETTIRLQRMIEEASSPSSSSSSYDGPRLREVEETQNIKSTTPAADDFAVAHIDDIMLFGRQFCMGEMGLAVGPFNHITVRLNHLTALCMNLRSVPFDTVKIVSKPNASFDVVLLCLRERQQAGNIDESPEEISPPILEELQRFGVDGNALLFGYKLLAALEPAIDSVDNSPLRRILLEYSRWDFHDPQTRPFSSIRFSNWTPDETAIELGMELGIPSDDLVLPYQFIGSFDGESLLWGWASSIVLPKLMNDPDYRDMQNAPSCFRHIGATQRDEEFAELRMTQVPCSTKNEAVGLAMLACSKLSNVLTGFYFVDVGNALYMFAFAYDDLIPVLDADVVEKLKIC